jgi:AraC family transcriptional regulator, transcriptional activator FtrA
VRKPNVVQDRRPSTLAALPSSIKIMPKGPPSRQRRTGPRVVCLAYDGLCSFEFGVAHEVFGLHRPEMGPHWYRFRVCAAEPGATGGAIRSDAGLTFSVDRGLGSLRSADLIVVPGWRAIDAPVPQQLISALRAAYRRGARVMSLCSGIAVLAAAGLLSRRRATTHWRYVKAIAVRYPDISLKPDVLYVDEGQVLTAAGSAAGIDLCLHVVRRDYGPEAANTVARRLVVPPHRDGGQAQFIERPVLRDREGERFAPLLDWMRRELARPLLIAELAERVGMSIRTFQRRFKAATGATPGEWIVAERLRYARELLERDAHAPLVDIAAASGFGSLGAMRHHFRSRLDTSPHAYRQRFMLRRP